MNDKIKECFTPHVLMHSLFGLGLGLLIANLWPGTAGQWYYGVVVMAVATVLDATRK